MKTSPMQQRTLLTFALLVLLCATSTSPAWADTFYVAADGNDSTGDGSETAPWATIAHAVNGGIPADGGHTIIVGDGEYNGPNLLSRGFPSTVVVQAEHDYMAKLTNLEKDGSGNILGGAEALHVYITGAANITIEGFLITNYDPEYVCASDGSERDRDLVHFQDVTDVVFRSNIVFGTNAPGTCNDMVKINRGGEEYYRSPKLTHLSQKG